MNTLRRFAEPPAAIPGSTSWYLADLGEARGKQELFTKQSPQRLKALREHALIESAVASNRIEGVEVEPARVGTVVFSKAHLRDRDEEEVRGYRKALDQIHAKGAALPIGESASPRGEKSGLVKAAIERAAGPFTVGDLQRECPGVSVDMIRHVLRLLQGAGQVRCVARGRNARWQRL